VSADFLMGLLHIALSLCRRSLRLDPALVMVFPRTGLSGTICFGRREVRAHLATGGAACVRHNHLFDHVFICATILSSLIDSRRLLRDSISNARLELPNRRGSCDRIV